MSARDGPLPIPRGLSCPGQVRLARRIHQEGRAACGSGVGAAASGHQASCQAAQLGLGPPCVPSSRARATVGAPGARAGQPPPCGHFSPAHGGSTVSYVKCPQQGQSHMVGGGAEPPLGSWYGSAETQLASQSQLKGPLLWEGGLLPEKSRGM